MRNIRVSRAFKRMTPSEMLSFSFAVKTNLSSKPRYTALQTLTTELADADKELWEVKNHGRKESRLCRVIPAEMLPAWAQASDWKGLKSVVEIQSQRTVLSTGVIESETRYYTIISAACL